MGKRDAAQMKASHTDEVKNLSFPYEAEVDTEFLSEYEVSGDWWGLLTELRLSLAVSREYEHLLYLLHSNGGTPWVTSLELPHPSGICFDQDHQRLIVSSTRTPNQLIEFRLLDPGLSLSEIIPDTARLPDGALFIPVTKFFLPGSLYTHDVALIGGELFVTATGHNFLARIPREGGWERVWWPSCLDGLARDQFNQNYLQLNSVSSGADIASCYLTGFSDLTTGPKPWKDGYGPHGKGVVFEAVSREVVLRELTCPHSARMHKGTLWLCNSGFGEVGFMEKNGASGNRFVPVTRVQGFTRGLAFAGDYGFVGLSKIIPSYEAYAPGLNATASQCGVVAFDLNTGAQVASLIWKNGYQIYDVQPMIGLDRPMLPMFPKIEDGINHYLRYQGWDISRVPGFSA